MHLLTIGMNHRTAPLDVRERAVIGAERVGDALAALRSDHVADEATILSTCNRTEIYCRQERSSPRRLIEWICAFHDLAPDDLSPYLYELPDQQAVRHAFRVAAGLDSMVLGEPQILGQMKDAFARAQRQGTTGKVLNRLFQQTFTVAKRVRTDTDIGASAVSVAFAAVDLAQQIFDRLSEKTVVLVGAGDTIELTARHMREHGVARMIVANRTVERARRLTEQFAGTGTTLEAITLGELPDRLHEADITITSTASQLPILGLGLVERALKRRRRRPMFMLDLAVPRDIEVEVDTLDDVYLYTVDDLQSVVQRGIESRRRAALAAERIIDGQVGDFMRWLHSLEAVPTIRSFRGRVEALKERELESARRRLARGDDPEEVMATLAHALARKFMHGPSEALRNASPEEVDELLEATRRMFRMTDDH